MNDTIDYTRLKDAFLELLDLDAGARELRLTEWETHDPALAGALRRQLQAAARPVPVLDRPVDAPRGPDLPNYTLIRELGRGGMGVVWLAERALDDARQPVALKRIAQARWSEDDLRRFQRERRILATLDHPGIAALVDGGADAHGVAYIATQYVEGEHIDQWCRTQALEVRARVRLLREVAAAVAHAHARLIVHRDLKPANILVTRDGAPKLLDFGIAHALQEDAVTTEGPSQMTLRYAAPEQVTSEGRERGVSVDVYALGVLLYEMLAGASPYGEASGPAALIQAILDDDPRPPSRLRSALAGVDADLDAICLKALRKRPDERYAGAAELLADLDRWLRREPVEARRGERGYRLRSFMRRRWPWLAAACLCLVAIGYHLHAQQQQLQEAERQRDKAQALAGHFSGLFEGARPADSERGEVSARELLERSITRLKADDRQSPAIRAALLLASARALDYFGQTHSVADAAAEGLRLAQAALPPDAELLAEAHSELASALDKRGDNVAAQREIDAGLALFASGQAKDGQRHLTLLQQHAMLAQDRGDAAVARAGYEDVVRAAGTMLDDEAALRSYLAAQVNLATAEMRADPTAAATRLREALRQARAQGFDRPQTLLPMRAYLGRALTALDRTDEALAVLDPLQVEARAHYGADDPWLGLILNVVGNAATLDGQFARADALLAESGRITARSVGEEHPNTRASEADRALVSVQAGDWPEALRRLTAILDWLEASGRYDSPLAQQLQAARAYVLARQRPQDATLRAALREAIGDIERWRGSQRILAERWLAWANRQP
ncbi:MAG: serine/threonine-protein kinase [Lysobacteraceae bacterium]